MFRSKKVKVNYLSYRYILFVSLCITISFFIMEGGKNAELLVLLALSPFYLFFQRVKVDRTDLLMYTVLALMLITGLLHAGFRWDTYVFSICFVCSFIYLKGEIKNQKFPLNDVIIITKYLIYLYTVVLIVQQICVILGIPPLLCSLYDPQNTWKLSSLSPEPSHLVIFVFFLMYAYVLLCETFIGRRYLLDDFKKDKILWAAYFWCMIASGSTSGLLYVLLIFVRYFKGRTLFLTTIVFALSLYVANTFLSDYTSFQRILNLYSAFLTYDSNVILQADGSAAYRLSPMFHFFNNIDLLDSGFWFGHGIDSAKIVLNAYMYDETGLRAYNTDGGVNMGSLWGFIIDYGIIVFSLFVSALVSFMKKIKDKWIVIFYTIIMMFIGFNMQILWFATVMLYMVYHYQQKGVNSVGGYLLVKTAG